MQHRCNQSLDGFPSDVPIQSIGAGAKSAIVLSCVNQMPVPPLIWKSDWHPAHTVQTMDFCVASSQIPWLLAASPFLSPMVRAYQKCVWGLPRTQQLRHIKVSFTTLLLLGGMCVCVFVFVCVCVLCFFLMRAYKVSDHAEEGMCFKFP